jgi:uncharacterized protein
MPDVEPPLRSKNPRRPIRWRRLILITLGVAIFLVNGVAYAIAWSMTHFQAAEPRAAHAEPLSGWAKVRRFCGDFALPRPTSAQHPGRWAGPNYSTLRYPGASGLELETWRIPGEQGRPLVLLFHGYAGSKTSLSGAAHEFHLLGCETWMVDFHGSGNSAGRTTTIGWDEAEDVAATLRKALELRSGNAPVILYGTSMGAAAILCAVHRFQLAPAALILESPFDRLLTTIGNRCQLLGLPSFPAANLLVFWGGVQGGFDGFAYNPVAYAREVRCPTLLLQGDQDRHVGIAHAREIAAALGSHGDFEIFAGAGHVPLLNKAPAKWEGDVRGFLEKHDWLGKGQPP